MKVPQVRSGSLRLGWQLVLSLAALLLALVFALDLRHLNAQRGPVIDAVAAGARAAAQAVCDGADASGVQAVAQSCAAAVCDAPVAAALDGDQVTVSAVIPVSSYFAPVVKRAFTRVQASALAVCGDLPDGAQVTLASAED